MKKYTTPLILIAVAILIFMSNINISIAREIVANWWPSGLIMLALWMYISNRDNFVWPFVIGILGVVLQVNKLGIANINFSDFIVPGILVAIALSIIFKNSSKERASKQSTHDTTAVMSGIDYNNASSDYKGGDVTAIMGGAKLDLRKATIKTSATLNVTILMGGVEIWVPENVSVEPKATCLLAGIENKDNPKNDKTLYINGTAIMGGIEIKR